MKTKGKVSEYIKANRKGSREAELEISPGWTAKTKVHKNRKKYDRKDRNWQNDSGFFMRIFSRQENTDRFIAIENTEKYLNQLAITAVFLRKQIYC